MKKTVGFDIPSRFTNVPLMETIDIVIDRVYREDAVITPPFKKLYVKGVLKRLLSACLDIALFIVLIYCNKNIHTVFSVLNNCGHYG